MILCDPQKKPADCQDCTRNKQAISHLKWEWSKCQSITWKADTGDKEPAPTDPFQSKFCSHIMLLLIKNSELKILFGPECCQKAAS